jgi:hypothetical protein
MKKTYDSHHRIPRRIWPTPSIKQINRCQNRQRATRTFILHNSRHHPAFSNEHLMPRRRKWQDYMDEKATIVSAGIDTIQPIKPQYKKQCEDATHQLQLSRQDITAPQQIAIFVNDGHHQRLRFVLTEDKLYRWLESIPQHIKVGSAGDQYVYEARPTIYLIKEEEQHKQFITAFIKRVGVNKVLNQGVITSI